VFRNKATSIIISIKKFESKAVHSTRATTRLILALLPDGNRHD
jgi:hypothetical protein